MKRLIYTAWIQRTPGALAYGRMTIPIMEDYAFRCGAELRVITKSNRLNPQHATLDMLCEVADEGRPVRTLFLDLDMVIHPQAPDVFEEFPEHFWVSMMHSNAWIKKEWRRYLKPMGHKYSQPYFSSCLMLFGGDHASKLAAAGARNENYPRVGDQAILNELTRNTEQGWLYFPRTITGPGSMGRRDAFMHCGGRNKGAKIRSVISELYP